MPPMTDVPEPEAGDPDLAAAELALGLSDGAERAVALRRLAAEPAFAREVEQWRAHFAVLLADVPAVAPPAASAQRVEARIDAGAGAVVPWPARPAAGRWRIAAFGASALAAVLAGVLVLRPGVAPRAPVVAPAPVFVAALQVPGGQQALLATYDRRAGLRLAGSLAVPGGRSAELWVITGGGPPRSLGVLHRAADRLDLPARLRQPMPSGATLAITIEPLGGSPSGLPTGPIVASGVMRQL